MRSKTAVLFVSALILSACTTDQERYQAQKERAANAVNEIQYQKDNRTGLCFAVKSNITNNSYYVESLATVPCEKVEHLIPKN